MHLLSKHFSTPIEREYESWIVQGIEQYFKELEICASVWAVSPANEVHWPADEHLLMGNRIVGLQMKKVTHRPLPSGDAGFGRLCWSLQNPKAQYELVLKFPDIYYCLPTFINRKYKEKAINHCLFWRPEVDSRNYKNAWYDNPKARKAHTPLREAPRWGLFIENMLSGNIGKKFNTDEEAISYINSIRNYMMNPNVPDQKEEEESSVEPNGDMEKEKSEGLSSRKGDNADSSDTIENDSIERAVYVVAVPE